MIYNKNELDAILEKVKPEFRDELSKVILDCRERWANMTRGQKLDFLSQDRAFCEFLYEKDCCGDLWNNLPDNIGNIAIGGDDAWYGTDLFTDPGIEGDVEDFVIGDIKEYNELVAKVDNWYDTE